MALFSTAADTFVFSFLIRRFLFREGRSTTEMLPAKEAWRISLGKVYSPKCVERLYEKVSNTDEPPRHEANHRSVHERFSARTKSLVIFAHPPVLADPSDRPLHHPPTR